MSFDNEEILDDARELRAELDHPEDRNYALRVYSDTLRVQYDEDVGLSNVTVRKRLEERGYTYVGVNFQERVEVFEKRGDGE